MRDLVSEGFQAVQLIGIPIDGIAGVKHVDFAAVGQFDTAFQYVEELFPSMLYRLG